MVCVMRREVPLLPNLVRSYFWLMKSGSRLRTLMDNCESGMEGDCLVLAAALSRSGLSKLDDTWAYLPWSTGIMGGSGPA